LFEQSKNRTRRIIQAPPGASCGFVASDAYIYAGGCGRCILKPSTSRRDGPAEAERRCARRSVLAKWRAGITAWQGEFLGV